MDTKKDLLYIAGALFKEADIRQRNHEKEMLTEKFGDKLEIFSPYSDNPSNDKSTNPTAEDIFVNDTRKILESKYIFAELDDEDVGVMAELGFAYAINLMRSLLVATAHRAEDYEELGRDVCKIIEDIPSKKVLAHLSDIRVPNAGEYEGHYVPVGLNQYCVGLVEMMGKIDYSTNEAMETLRLLLEEESDE